MKNENYFFSINGESVSSKEQIDVINPATGISFATCPVATRQHLDDAVEAANQAFILWSSLSWDERVEKLLMVADCLDENATELANLLTLEQGKPNNQHGSVMEIGACGFTIRESVKLKLETENILGCEVRHEPLGVVASISPWNFPVVIAIAHSIPALLVGNTVVIKPSPYTPLSTLKAINLISKILPPGVINCIAGRDELGQWMSEHKKIQKIVFTGSCDTGKKIMNSSAATLKRLTLEMGGNDAAIVLDDVNPEEIVEKLFWSAFINNGQTCAAIKRLYVHASKYDEVCDALVNYSKNIVVGDGSNEETMLGPIQNKMQLDKVSKYVEGAIAAGGRVLCGGQLPSSDGYFYPITLIADIGKGVPLVEEEQFGPVLPIIKFDDIDSAIEQANNTVFALGGSVWSSDISRAKEIALKLDAGTVWINQHATIHPHVPFSGAKESGIGVASGIEGLKEFTQTKVLSIAGQD